MVNHAVPKQASNTLDDYVIQQDDASWIFKMPEYTVNTRMPTHENTLSQPPFHFVSPVKVGASLFEAGRPLSATTAFALPEHTPQIVPTHQTHAGAGTPFLVNTNVPSGDPRASLTQQEARPLATHSTVPAAPVMCNTHHNAVSSSPPLQLPTFAIPQQRPAAQLGAAVPQARIIGDTKSAVAQDPQTQINNTTIASAMPHQEIGYSPVKRTAQSVTPLQVAATKHSASDSSYQSAVDSAGDAEDEGTEKVTAKPGRDPPFPYEREHKLCIWMSAQDFGLEKSQLGPIFDYIYRNDIKKAGLGDKIGQKKWHLKVEKQYGEHKREARKKIWADIKDMNKASDQGKEKKLRDEVRVKIKEAMEKVLD